MKKSRKLRYLKRPLAAILALTLAVGGISYTPPTAEAAAKCKCQAMQKIHDTEGKKLTEWAKSTDGIKEIKSWNESTATVKDVHIVKAKGKMYAAWYQKNQTAVNDTRYHTDGYHVRADKYSLGVTSFKKGEGKDLMEGEGFAQTKMCNAGSGAHYTLYYVGYEELIEMCKKAGVAHSKMTFSNGSSKGTYHYYEAYLQPYISVYYNGNKKLGKGECYDTVHNMFKKYFSKASQDDLKEKYNVKVQIPFITVPVTVRFWDISDPEDWQRMANEDGKDLAIHTEFVQAITFYETADSTAQTLKLNFNEVLNSIKDDSFNYVRDIYRNKTGEFVGDGFFVGCQAMVEQKKFAKVFSDSRLMFDVDALAELDEITNKTKGEVVVDDRVKKTLLEDKKVTPERLFESMTTSCVFDDIQPGEIENDGKGRQVQDGDVCYLDLFYVSAKNIQYKYEVTRTVALYDPETKKYYGTKNATKLIDEEPVAEDNITNDNQFTLTLGKKKYPDYAEGSKNNALGCVEYEGHKYVLAKSGLAVKPNGSKTSNKWYNVNKKAEGWAAGASFERVGGNYAYNTTAFNTALSSYRYYTDSNVIPKYGDSATWTIRNTYVCRPPLVQLNYEYNKETDSYKLLDTVPASLTSSDSLAYEFAKDELTKSVPTYKLGKPLQNVRVGTGFVEPYDGLTSYSDNSYPMLNEVVLKKEVVGSDRVQNKLDVVFTMPYDMVLYNKN